MILTSQDGKKSQFVLSLSHEFPLDIPSSRHKLKRPASCFRKCFGDESCTVVAIGDEVLFAENSHDDNCMMFSNQSVLLHTRYEEGWKVYKKVEMFKFFYSSLDFYDLLSCKHPVNMVKIFIS